LLKLGDIHALESGGGKSEGRQHSEENEPAHFESTPRVRRHPRGDGRRACIELYTGEGIEDNWEARR
jgi:hypothetical protein